MQYSDMDEKKFDAWLSTGLKNSVSTDNKFAERLLARLNEQQEQQAEMLLARVGRQQKICKVSVISFVFAGVGLLVYPPVTTAVYNFLQTVFTNMIDLILEPSLTGLIIPAGILLTAIAVLWNLIDMISLE